MRQLLPWFGWTYVGCFSVWLLLRLGFADRIWAILIVNAIADALLILFPIFLMASLFFRYWRLLGDLGIVAIAFMLVVEVPFWLHLTKSPQETALPLTNHIKAADTLLVCGWDEVFALKLAANDAKPTKIWSWRAATSPGLPKLMATEFKTTDECKPIEQGQKVLITSSTNGVALVEQITGKTLFYGSVTGAHSADLLPKGRVAVAGSDGVFGGHTLVLFDLKTSDRPLWKTELYSGHGVYWDQDREVLWALGGPDLREYELANWDTQSPSLKLKRSFPLPSYGGHDLVPMPDRSTLLITTNSDVVQFDVKTQTFSSDPRLKNLAAVKGVDIHPVTGRLVYVQAEGGHWWSPRLHFLEAQPSKTQRTVVLPNERLYKARWLD